MIGAGRALWRLWRGVNFSFRIAARKEAARVRACDRDRHLDDRAAASRERSLREGGREEGEEDVRANAASTRGSCLAVWSNG